MKVVTGKLIERHFNAPQNTTESILFKLVLDFTDRRGLRQEWDCIDKDIQEEILQTWYEIINSEIRQLK